MTSPPDGTLDEAALEALYRRLERPLYNVVYRWLWDREESLDVVQEAFVRLWRMRRRVRLATVEPLLYRIALNLAASRRRWRRLRRWLHLDAVPDPVATEPDAERLVAADSEQRRLRAAIEALPEDLRRVVVLCELGEMPYEEVARVIDIPIGTVGSRRHRALKLLRERLTAESPS